MTRPSNPETNRGTARGTAYGTVYLIGSGPGDPGLVTLKARQCMEKAQVVVYDYLAPKTLLEYAGEDAQIIYVGKKGANHTLPQDQINDLLVEKARQGLTVARLKGGDPFVFGRGGEEAQILLEQGVPCEVIPGVTSAIAAPAYAGIPITHREHNSFVTFITGHENPDKPSSSMQWDVFAKSQGTLVFLMGVKNLPHIVDQLIRHGKEADTPVALVQWGTTPRQRTVTGTLETIVSIVHKENISSPAIIVVGKVVELREQLAWFDKRPLFGKTIVVTRARAQASELVANLTDLGAQCLEIPTIKIQPPEDNAPLRKALEQIHTYDWVVLTSVNGVKFFFDTLFAMGRDVRALGHVKFACIGPVTRDRLRDFGITADILPETFQAESVVQAFSQVEMSGKNVLLPRASKARTILPQELTKMGAKVHEVFSYETVLDDSEKDTLIQSLEEKQIHAVTFTSSSTVSNFMSLLEGKDIAGLLKDVALISIGPITSDTIRSFGLAPAMEAEPFTIKGLVDTLIRWNKTKG